MSSVNNSLCKELDGVVVSLESEYNVPLRSLRRMLKIIGANAELASTIACAAMGDETSMLKAITTLDMSVEHTYVSREDMLETICQLDNYVDETERVNDALNAEIKDLREQLAVQNTGFMVVGAQNENLQHRVGQLK